jgi:hypothetical protein
MVLLKEAPMADTGSMSGQAGGGGGDSVFGGLGGGVQHGTDLMPIQDGPRNNEGHATNNPSGDGVAPRQDSVFGDLGGSGVQGQEGGAMIPNSPGRDPGGQGGY